MQATIVAYITSSWESLTCEQWLFYRDVPKKYLRGFISEISIDFLRIIMHSRLLYQELINWVVEPGKPP